MPEGPRGPGGGVREWASGWWLCQGSGTWWLSARGAADVEGSNDGQGALEQTLPPTPNKIIQNKSRLWKRFCCLCRQQGAVLHSFSDLLQPLSGGEENKPCVKERRGSAGVARGAEAAAGLGAAWEGLAYGKGLLLPGEVIPQSAALGKTFVWPLDKKKNK